MNHKRKAFLNAYLKTFNATEAARIADYAHPGSQGHRLLKDVEIQAAIQARLDEMVMAADEVLARLADQARASFEDFLRYDEAEDQLAIDLAKAGGRGKLHLVKKLAVDKDGGMSLELYSAQAALKLLGQHHKLFTQNHEHELKDEKLKQWLNALIGAGSNDEPVAHPGSEMGDVPPDGVQPQSEPGPDTS